VTAATVPESRPSAPAPAHGALRLAGGLLAVALATVAVWLLYFELHVVIGRRAFGWALLFAFAPVVPLAAAFLWLDRMRPEPAKLLAVALLWGALGATYLSLKLNAWFAAQVGDVGAASARSAVFVAPWVEETAKAAVIFAIVLWRRHHFNAVVAGIVYGGVVGIGFAFTENIVYYGQVFQQVYDAADNKAALDAVGHLFFWRGMAAPFVHPMFTMMTGAGIGFAVRHRHLGVRVLAPVAGFCAAALLHMGYNTIASFADQQGLIAVYAAILVPTVLALLAVILAVRRHEHSLMAARLHDYTAYGWLQSSQIPYIATTSGRRAARRHAKQFGTAQRDRVRTFQRDGTELGLVRDRIVRGVVGRDELAREAELIAALREHRRHVLLPDGSGSPPAELSARGSSW
jgi:protease PrsW